MNPLLGLPLLLMIQPVTSVFNWLSLALLNTPLEYLPQSQSLDMDKSHFEMLCNRLSGLNSVQKSICVSHPFSIPFVSRGIRDSIYECQQQYKFERWNCSDRYEISNTTYGQFHDILGKTLRSTTKESAFLTAIASAGIVHAVTKGCNTGNLTDCGCDTKPALQKYHETIEIAPSSSSLDGATAAALQSNPMAPHPVAPPIHRADHFSWGGCSDNVGYGVRYARKFLDEFEKSEFEKTHDVRHLVAIHNHFVGREAIAQYVKKNCRCHGVSGSCEFRTCWLQMPKMQEVAEQLKKRYDNFAVQVTKRAKKRLRRKERTERSNPIRGNEMAYVARSPTYCERNDTLGILGTAGRECSHNSLNADSCDLMCCGRGYNTRVERRVTQCNCKFVWCCQVKCKECVDNVAVHTCK